MARIFRAIFGEMLPDRVELMEVDGKERLPSPQELQGKIILKGSYKGDDVMQEHPYDNIMQLHDVIVVEVWCEMTRTIVCRVFSKRGAGEQFTPLSPPPPPRWPMISHCYRVGRFYKWLTSIVSYAFTIIWLCFAGKDRHSQESSKSGESICCSTRVETYL